MTSHYSVLGISASASPEEVRGAYRKQVKAVHPDLNQGTSDSVERMKELVSAWEVLGDPVMRREYDRRNGYLSGRDAKPESEFDYAEFLRARRHDRESQSKLVFYDLLHDNPDEALLVYDSLCATGDFELYQYLDREDFMDCAFLLAEEYESRMEFRRAFDLYAAIVRFEQRRPYFRHFMADVYDRLRTVVCFRMPAVECAETVLNALHQMIDWELPRKDTAFCYRKIAELHLQNGDRRAAYRNLQRGLALDSRLAGVKKLQQELGYFETV